jgi:hypothetical protein
MGRVKVARGYTLGKDHDMKDVLEVEAELLRSEGVDPAWPGFEADRKRRKKPRQDR